MRNLWMACAALSALALAGCSNNVKQYGRIIGFVVDASTGSRLNVFTTSGDLANSGNDGSAANDIYALIDGSFKRAQPCGTGDANKSNAIPADGCFRFEGVPANTNIQIFAKYAGYESFQGTTRVVTNASTVTDLLDTDPQVIGNIALFPVGYTVDYTIHTFTTNNGNSSPIAVPNVAIKCQHAVDVGYNYGVDGSDFIEPEATTIAAFTLTTGADGNVVIQGAQLVLGAHYQCTYTSSDDSVPLGSFTFLAGQSTRVINVNVGAFGPQTLYVLSSSNDNAQAITGGDSTVTYTFNTAAEFVPGTIDCQEAVLSANDTNNSGNLIPQLPADVLNNGISETMTSSLSGDGLTLTLTTKPYTHPLDPNDIGAKVTYEGVLLRTKNSNQQTNVWYIGATNPNGSNSCILGTEYVEAGLRDVNNAGVNATVNLY